MPSHLNLKDMQSIAGEYGGKCLSKAYINNHTPLEWICKKGHRWDSAYSIVQQGGWCRQCAKDEDLLQALKDHAKKKEGRCLSNFYINSISKYKFQCKNAHVFFHDPSALKKGFWCKICNRDQVNINRLQKMQTVAKRKGGKCLSLKYNHTKLNLKWQCAKGHIWLALPPNIERGGWCPVCTKKAVDEKQRKYSVKELQQYAKKKGGQFLSKEYTKISVPVKWQCSKGHIWQTAVYNVIEKKTWCYRCKLEEKKKNTLEELKKIAEGRGGKLLSKEYIDRTHSLKWQCSEGHIWTNNAASINSGKWCYQCEGRKTISRNPVYSLAYFQELAKNKGGKLLAKKYNNATEHLQWQCANGHTWMAPASGIKQGFWCRKCFNEKQKSTIEEFRLIAKARGGKVLSDKYINNHTKLKWECKKGHVWLTAPQHIKAGRWCPTCGREVASEKTKYSMEELRQHAKKRGGKLLSKTYIDCTKHLEWQCNKGHVWQAVSSLIINKNAWCPVCNVEKRRSSIKEFQQLAKKNKGLLLSEKYTNSNLPLKWQCSKGHKWMATAGSVKSGSWCAKCYHESKKSSIHDFQKIAKTRGGKLLSKTYINSFTHLEWQCSKKHTWLAVPAEIKRGSWCPACAGRKKRK